MTNDCLLGKVETSHHFGILSIILILMLAYSQPEKYALLLCILIHSHCASVLCILNVVGVATYVCWECPSKYLKHIFMLPGELH